MISVVVADDHPMFRDGLAVLLDGQPDMMVAATAGTGREAVEAVELTMPDVAILDLRMPDGDGLSAATAILRVSPATRLLVLTSFDSADQIGQALAHGVHGYLVKSAAPEEIVQAVRAVAAGAAVLGDRVLATLASGAVASDASRFPELTRREVAVLRALARGAGTEEAAASLGMSNKTVRNHVASITVKLGVRDRTAAVLVARERGLGVDGA